MSRSSSLAAPPCPAADAAAARPWLLLHQRLPRDLLAAVTSPVRLEILGRLRDAASDVKTLAERLELAEDLVSYHLRQLRRQRLVVFEQDRTRRIYALGEGVTITADGRGLRLRVERDGAVRLLVTAPARRPAR